MNVGKGLRSYNAWIDAFSSGKLHTGCIKKREQILNSRERARVLKFGPNWEVTDPLRSTQVIGPVPFLGTVRLWLFTHFPDSWSVAELCTQICDTYFFFFPLCLDMNPEYILFKLPILYYFQQFTVLSCLIRRPHQLPPCVQLTTQYNCV